MIVIKNEWGSPQFYAGRIIDVLNSRSYPKLYVGFDLLGMHLGRLRKDRCEDYFEKTRGPRTIRKL